MVLQIDRARSAHTANPERLAVIDIGSNSIRLVVYDGLSRAPTPIFNEKILCGLGRTVEKKGCLDPEGVALALANLSRFARLAKSMNVRRTDVLATAAVRDADDGPAFVDAVRREAGLSVKTISGEEEARLSAMGVLSGTPGAHGIMGDLGGGSMELVGLDHGVIGPQVTLPLGPLRLMEVSGGRVAAIRMIEEHLARLSWIDAHRGRVFYPVGGSWRAMAKAFMAYSNHPLHIIHHYEVCANELAVFADLVAKQSKSSLEKMPGISRRRADTLPYAALVLDRVLKAASPERVVFSAYGLREGHLFDLLDPQERSLDPLICACATVAERLGRFGEGEIVADWTAPLFAGEDDASRRLRRAACLLSDLGWAEHPDYRAEHAYLRILRMPFAGTDHAERAFMALAIFVRYGGRVDDKTTEVAQRLLNDGLMAKANILGHVLRLAHTLTGGVGSLLRRTALRLDDEALTLILPEDAAMLGGNVVQRRLEAVAKALNRRGEIVLPPSLASVT